MGLAFAIERLYPSGMSVVTERLQGVLKTIVRQVSQSLPHDALQALNDEIDALEQPIEKPADPYEGKTPDELLQLAQGGDQEALRRYVAAINPTTIPIANPTVAQETGAEQA